MSAGLGFVLLVTVTVVIWWRNHDILSDLYDYSSIVAAAGKIEVGLKPYVDFRSTMQSSTYLLNRGAEIVFGRSYLGLTAGGLTLSLVGAVVLFALLRRSFGVVGGLMLAAAVVWSGLGQHVIVFYNTVGILCLAIVVIGVAQCPRLGSSLTWDRSLVLGALVLGGLNKINFQYLALALAAVLVLDAHLARHIDRREAIRSLLVLAGAGMVIPLAVELVWTGATPSLWFENVISLASERIDYMRRLVDPAVYVGPAHDLHHHIPFKRLTLLGLALLAAVGLPVVRAAWHAAGTSQTRLWRMVVLGTYILGAAVGGVLLTITNVESITLTSLAFLISATALGVTGVNPAMGHAIIRTRLAWLLPAAGTLWAVNGGVAAWHGSRVLFAREDGNRSVFVRLQNVPPTLRYLEGVRLDANLHHSLLLVAHELEQLKSRRGNLSGVLFGPAFEWLERAYPKAVLPGMPVWYHVGTSLRADDGDWMVKLMERHQVDRILANPSWEIWPKGFQAMLAKKYRPVSLGLIARLHEKIGSEQFVVANGSFDAREPLTMIERTGSNLHLLGSPVPEGFDFSVSPWGDCIGRAGGWQWDWCGGLAIVEGQIVAQRLGDTALPARFSVRVNTIETQGAGEDLWRTVATVEAGQAWARLPFRITPYGRPVRISVESEQGEAQEWHFGCREVQIRQTMDLVDRPPPPTIVALPGRQLELSDGKEAWFRSADAVSAERSAGQTSPLEIWTERISGVTPWRVTLETEQLVAEQGTLPVVMLLWSRAGRIELLSQQAINRQSPREISLEGWMPEPGGWLGVAVRPMERGKAFNMKVRVKKWKF